MKCPFCGEKNIEGTDLCDACGGNLSSIDVTSTKDALDYSIQNDPVSVFRLSPPIVVSPTTSIEEVAKKISERLACALVVDKGQLVGIVTKRDILFKVLGKIADVKKTSVSKIMTPNPGTLKSTDKIALALHIMAMRGYRHIPIVENSKPLGIVTVRDVVEYLAKKFPDTAGVCQ